jgi:branched-chain amino acid transport system permease protein
MMSNFRDNLQKWIKPALLVILLVLLATLPYYASSYWVVKMINIMMYVVLAVAWVMFSGPTNYISLASSAFFGVGVYTSAVMGKDFPLFAIIIFGGIFSFVLAFITGALTLRLKGIYFAMFTFGLVLLIKQLLLYWEFNITRTRGRFVVLESNETIYFVILIIFVVLVITAYLIRRSKYGLALQSIGEFEEAAAHTGINVTMVKIVTFAISAFFAGAIGAIMATKWTYVDPYVAFDPQRSFMPVLMAIFGGIGQLYGPVIGAVIFAYLAEILQTKFPFYYMLTFGIILVGAILYLPEGIVGLVQKLQKWISGAQRAHT